MRQRAHVLKMRASRKVVTQETQRKKKLFSFTLICRACLWPVAVQLSCTHEERTWEESSRLGMTKQKDKQNPILDVGKMVNYPYLELPSIARLSFVRWYIFFIVYKSLVGIFCYLFPKSFCLNKECRSWLHFRVSLALTPQNPWCWGGKWG